MTDMADLRIDGNQLVLGRGTGRSRTCSGRKRRGYARPPERAYTTAIARLCAVLAP